METRRLIAVSSERKRAWKLRLNGGSHWNLLSGFRRPLESGYTDDRD